MSDVSLNRPIKVEVAPADEDADSGVLLDSNSTGWTDEKHMLYLSSMEACFVEQLRCDEQQSRDLLGGSTKTRNENHFKVLRRGVWEDLRFLKTSNPRASSGDLSANPWIRHFKSRDPGRHANAGPIDNPVDGHESKFPPRSQMHSCRVADKSTEVSDQNFVDDEEVQSGAEASMTCKKKRPRSLSANLLNDQVVPSGKSHATRYSSTNQDVPKDGIKD